MKIRIASVTLALALIFSVVSMAYAADAVWPEEPADPAAPLQEEQDEEQTAAFYLDGEPLYDVVCQSINGTYYVTLASMMALIDPNAVVEETADMATLTAEAVVVSEQPIQWQEPEQPEGETSEEAVQLPQEGEDDVQAEDDVQTPEDAFHSLAAGEAVAEVLDTLTLTAVVGEEYLIANGRYLYAEDGIITLNGSVAVPLRLLAKALKLSVWFDTDSKSVFLARSNEIGYLEDGEDYYDSEAVYWLSRIIYCESGNQVLAGKIAVGNVILNRVSDPKFPSSIYAVIFQKNQFGPASSGSIHRDPNESSIIAAKLTLDGAVALDDVLFFNRAGQSCYASRNRTYVATIGSHAFYA